MKNEDIASCETLRSQVNTLYKELHPHALKKPHDPVNKFKLGVVNGVLLSINALIGEEYMPIKGFVSFEEDSIPTISDVSLVIDQYIHAIEVFRSRNINYDDADNCWYYIIDENDEDDYLFVETDPPTVFRG